MSSLNPPYDVSSSPELSHGIDLIRALPGFFGYRFNPQACIKAVNYLRHIGRDRALKTLQNYCVLAAQTPTIQPENALLVARVLFVCRDQQLVLPPFQWGAPDPQAPEDPALLPLFPLDVQADIPLLLISGYRLGGEVLPPALYIQWCADHADIRAAPLVPSRDPLATVDEFLTAAVWRSLNPSPAHDQMLRLQALRAVACAYPTDLQEETALATTFDEHWRRHRQAFASLQVLWNPLTDEYER